MTFNCCSSPKIYPETPAPPPSPKPAKSSRLTHIRRSDDLRTATRLYALVRSKMKAAK